MFVPNPSLTEHRAPGAGPLTLDDNTEVLEKQDGRRLVLKAKTRPLGAGTIIAIDRHFGAAHPHAYGWGTLFGNDFRGHKAYLCGPPLMIDACITTLMQGRLFEKDIFTEKFLSAADAQQVRSLHEDIEDQVVYHVLLPVEDASARIRTVFTGCSGVGAAGIDRRDFGLLRQQRGDRDRDHRIVRLAGGEPLERQRRRDQALCDVGGRLPAQADDLRPHHHRTCVAVTGLVFQRNSNGHG